MGIWDLLFTVAIGAAVGAAAGAGMAYVIDYYITKAKLKEEAKKEFARAFMIKIKEVQANKGATKVGIFSDNGTEIAERIYQSSKGISSDIQVGQVIIL